MDGSHLLPWVMARPFEPFIIYMSDGRSLKVAHPENAAVTKYAIALHIFHDSGHLEMIDYAHVTSVRTVNPVDLTPYL